jgi:hypothetical protein
MQRGLSAVAVACVLLAGSCTTGSSGAAGSASPGGSAETRATSGGAAATPPGLPADSFEPTAAAGPSPVEAVQAFYDWYLAGGTIAQARARPDVTATLAAVLEDPQVATDPFTCTAEAPASITAITSSLGGTTAIVSTIVSDGSTDSPGPPVTVVLSGGRWQLESVGCGR